MSAGFDRHLYFNVHYYQASEDAPPTQYAIAMTELAERLRSSDAFKPLQLTDDFTVSWVFLPESGPGRGP